MYINDRTGTVQELVAVHKRHPHFQAVRAPWEHAGSAIRCPLWPNIDHCTRPLCEVPIM
ncbi:unnamed protein product [Staurois parvus]|uniref:Uncharacterized protein n=1 Tax=Staurois parvus TaxID=386267 RepID=A0ABN9B3B2_9NEOB|nr:unnamed protein product [Staurois parvus]